jgi:uncharacterized membrane protein (UPF0127 family)
MLRDKKMMTFFVAVVLILCAVIVGVWWYVLMGQPNPPLPRTNVAIQGLSSGTVPAAGAAGAARVFTNNATPGVDHLSIDAATFSVEIASTSVEQTRGLSYRASLGENDGMLFLFSTGTIQTFWMKDMNFPLDMIWISGNIVDGFTQNIPAPAPGTPLWELPIYASPDHTDKVLEVNAGTVAKYQIKVGDSVIIGPIE